MKILLVSINASFMHTSLAVRCLKNYTEKKFSSRSKAPAPEIEYGEFTINQPAGEMLRSIGFSGAELVLFSTYIWNAEYVSKIIPDVKKVLPGAIVGAGGPEFGYGAEKYLKAIPALDFITFGEGEETFLEICVKLSECQGSFCEKIELIKAVKGNYYRNNQNENTIAYSGDRPLIENLDDIPFAYPEIIAGEADPDHKIYYYESSRGCPFNCAYCLSSVDKRVRFKSLERVVSELQVFLDNQTALVKFVDRTYNLNPDRYIGIWQYILDHHNGKTMFHFEIEAEYLSEEALSFLQKVPSGVMQFEMGVQSANKTTLKAINRSPETEKLAENIRRIPRTIHQHLDLIAGLPFENIESFGKSYDYVMALRPDALQLGFLKVLSGTLMEKYARENNWQWMESPVYECFSTPYISFAEMAFLKEIEIITDAYWNKGIFKNTMNYIFRIVSPWGFFSLLHNFLKNQNAFIQARKDAFWFEKLAEFFASCVRDCSTACGVPKGWSVSGSTEASTAQAGTPEKINLLEKIDYSVAENLLRYDFVLTGKKGNFPEWYCHRYDKNEHRRLLDENDMLGNSRIGFAFTEYEEFDFDVTSAMPENCPGQKKLLIKYK